MRLSRSQMRIFTPQAVNPHAEVGRLKGARSRRSRLLLLALTTSIVWAGLPSSAGAVDGRSDFLPTAGACVGDATRSAGFIDTVGVSAEKAIDCLAYYGITQGSGADRFSPNAPIARWQMALFLARTASLAGLNVGTPVEQGFTDISDLRPEAQDAINWLTFLRITRGTSPTTYSPNALVDRRQMALFLYRLLSQLEPGPGGAAVGSVVADDTSFDDIGHLDEATMTAIQVLSEMGILAGRSATVFAPSSIVTRAHMALFISRALAHTNIRPAGITIQTATERVVSGDTTVFHVSLRTPDFRPVTGERVDMFGTTRSHALSSFDGSGQCVFGVRRIGGRTACGIDQGDQRTDEMGNVSAIIHPEDHMAVWAWTGTLDSPFVLGSDDFDLAYISVLKEAVAVTVTDNLPPTALAVPMGRVVELLVQLVDEDGEPVANQGSRVQVSRFTLSSSLLDEDDRDNVKTYLTDEAGQVLLSLVGVDPDESIPEDFVEIDIDIDAGGLDVIDRTTMSVVRMDDDPLDDRPIVWLESPSTPTVLHLVQSRSFHAIPESGPGSNNVVRALLADQYGVPVPGEKIRFSSDDPLGLGEDFVERGTDEDGLVVLRYFRDGRGSAIETVTAWLVGASLEDTIKHIWAEPVGDYGSLLGAEILAYDLGRNQIVVNGDGPQVITYAQQDRLTLEGRPVSIVQFEEALQSGRFGRVSFTTALANRTETNNVHLTNNAFDQAN